MHLVVTSGRNAVSDESLNGFKVLDFRSRSSGLKSDEFQRCSEVEMFFPVESGKEPRKRSAEVRGALVEWKDKAARLDTKLKVFRRVLAHIFLILLGSNKTAD